jgi:hypothetical protein
MNPSSYFHLVLSVCWMMIHCIYFISFMSFLFFYTLYFTCRAWIIDFMTSLHGYHPQFCYCILSLLKCFFIWWIKPSI